MGGWDGGGVEGEINVRRNEEGGLWDFCFDRCTVI